MKVRPGERVLACMTHHSTNLRALALALAVTAALLTPAAGAQVVAASPLAPTPMAIEGQTDYVDETRGNVFKRFKINPTITVVDIRDDRGIVRTVNLDDLSQENQKLVENDLNVLQKTEDYIQNLYTTVLKHFLKPFDWKYAEGAPVTLRSEIIIALCEEVIKCCVALVCPVELLVIALQVAVPGEGCGFVGGLERDMDRRQVEACADRLERLAQRGQARAVAAGEKPGAGCRREGHRDLQFRIVAAARAFEGLGPAMVEDVLAVRVGLHIGRRCRNR